MSNWLPSDAGSKSLLKIYTMLLFVAMCNNPTFEGGTSELGLSLYTQCAVIGMIPGGRGTRS